jgi:hypothetical protein
MTRRNSEAVKNKIPSKAEEAGELKLVFRPIFF